MLPARHAFEMLVQDLNAQITQSTQDRDEKAASKAKKLQAPLLLPKYCPQSVYHVKLDAANFFFGTHS